MTERHLTVSGFVVHEGRVALYWHRKLGAWLPSGGHIEAGEDPVQATLRELQEEFAIEAEVLPISPRFDYTGGPVQLESPHCTIDCWAGDHWHVNFVYFCRHLSGYPGLSEDPENPILWLGIADLESGAAEHDGRRIDFAPDVKALAIASLEAAQRYEAPGSLSPSPRIEERGQGGEVTALR